ncbi:hypothetical protein O6H91_01G041600 [Diphasiastrum complanatum]|uniref:Uncharacterized protein n=1 Tax=Diphasiastrum complanatum TaxID=34168 RepID=A0ACC2EQ26_DIPCM|nr:hypothetical protein O6H91_01G041600 [Diphasiastrum complanatum]
MRNMRWMKFVQALLLLLMGRFFGADAVVFLWPQPQSISWGTGPPIHVSPKSLQLICPSHPDLQKATHYYTTHIFTERWFPVQVSHLHPTNVNEASEYCLEALEIIVADLNADLQHGVDESYNLTVPDEGGVATLAAKTVWGAIHGLETFSQLIRLTKNERDAESVIERGVVILDKPNFPHRGILLDTSRNFFSKEHILRTIRALGYNKLNVFHWHITDSQSFPIALPSEPTLAEKGSYGHNYIYSQKDVEEIVSYARAFGIRVIPEVDMPGHSSSWGGAYPEIVVCNNQFWLRPGATDPSDAYAYEPTPGQLNPLLSKTYEVVKNVVKDVSKMFPDQFYHAGADEINILCWENNTIIQEYINKGNKLKDALTKFINTTKEYILSHNKTAIYWADVIISDTVKADQSAVPPQSSILQTWNGGPLDSKALINKGYRIIVSHYDWYYLDCGHGQWMGKDPNFDQDFNDDPHNYYNWAPGGDASGTAGDWCPPYKTWARIYDYDLTARMSVREAKMVLGGEVALWTEQVDETVLDSRLWPRSSALAESLWSGNRDKASGKKRTGTAIDRLNDWRFHMVKRGIMAEPLQPLWCLKNPQQCDFTW